MWLRHALKSLLAILVISACSPSDRQQVDKLNSLSYVYHYRSLDSVEHYACEAIRMAVSYNDGRAEALNNLAFVNIMRMRYDGAKRQLDSIPLITDNHVELFISYVQQMRLCQRQSRNRDFYEYRELAYQSLARINEASESLSDRQRQRMLYGESELSIVSSTYYYYVGLERQSVAALDEIDPDEIKRDTAQFLNYLYNVGAGGILTEGTQEEICQREFDHLLRCYQIAVNNDYPFFAANALEGLADHLIDDSQRRHIADENPAGMRLINPEDIAEDELPMWLANNALELFRSYGDIYQIAGAYRTLASCCRAAGDNEATLYNLEQSLKDTTIMQAPDLVASIYEQMSVALAAVNDKSGSDSYRNSYLDLQEQTRQDRQLEARAFQLEHTVIQLNWILLTVIVAIALLLFLLWLFNYLNKKQKAPVYNDLLEEKGEELAVKQLHLEKAQRLNLEQRAKVSLIQTITPLIDRMLHDVNRLETAQSSENSENSENSERLEYIRELTEKIESDNKLLTQWIQLRQGELSLHIESFPLQSVFDIVERARRSFQLKSLTLNVNPTDAVVKADRILTLFMVNTLADNARKFTPEGGSVTISANATDSYVEVSVSDTGIGMTEEQLAHLFDHKPIVDAPTQTSHGFGLLNCKGIIEKYRKLSSIFSVCTIQAESQEGRGSRFFFRMPRGVVHLLMAVLLLVPSALFANQHLMQAEVYADSAYFSNINGTYEQTLRYADSCLTCLNRHYIELQPTGKTFMLSVGDMSVMPAEITWFHDSLATNYRTILDIRNETAVAALALHQWQLYSYNNRIYTQLFKELSADPTLSDYCRTMQQSQTNKTIAIILLVLVLIAIVPAYYFLYLRHRLYERYQAEKLQRDQVDALEDQIRCADHELSSLHVSNAVLDNCLSALKHETMYYPSRIRQLIDQNDLQSLPEVTAYYRELYGLLSQQAALQADVTKLHLQPLSPDQLNLPSATGTILGDETLLRYLFAILRRYDYTITNSKSADNGLYIELTIEVKNRLSDIDQLLCRQILRDHGEAAHRRRCSIREEHDGDRNQIIITLPKYGKVQSNNR